MPTVGRVGGLRIVIYANDHRPEHVHVMGGGCEAVFHLHCPDGPPSLRENYGFNRREMGRIKAALHADLSGLCQHWKRIHEQP